ncbi:MULTISPECIES: ABC transporter substrate-binding protein [Vibrio]|uniref:ABC transporter substrate-binding protein n=1 Tax=Vibrio TaxID=662 RepID=UPI003D12F136
MKNNSKRQRVSVTPLIFLSAFTTLVPSIAHTAQLPKQVQLATTQHVVRGNDAEVATLDPAKAEGLPEMHVIRDLFEGLVIQDADGNVVPGVAKSWETKDNKTFIFHLRSDAKWSNGDPVVASDFVFALKRAADPATASPNGWYLKMTKINNIAMILNGEKPVSELGVKAIDDQTLEFTLDSAVPYFVAMTGHTSMMPIHQASMKTNGDKWARAGVLVSNGAFTLKQWVVNERIELARNSEYWDNSNTVLNAVTFIPFESQTAAMNRYMTGEVDITSDVPAQMAEKLKNEQQEAYKVVPLLCTYYYAFNTTRAPFNDERVRKAVSYTIMRDVITNGITQVGNIPAYTFSHQYVAGFSATQPEYSRWTQKQRDQQAQQWLAEAGYGVDKPLEAKLLYNTSESNKSIAVAISSMMKKNLGAKVELENQEWKSYLVARREGDFDILRTSWCGDYNEASTFLSLMTSDSAGNRAFYKSDAYDKQISSALLATDSEVRNQHYDQAESILVKDMPIAPIYYYMQARLVRPTIGGFPVNNVEGRIYSKDLYVLAQ